MSATTDLGSFAVLGVRLRGRRTSLRDAIMVAITLASLALTSKVDRAANGFVWEPIVEVAKLFAGIFVAIIPVLAMLRAGSAGAFAPLVALVSNPDGTAERRRLFLAHRRPLVLPRQRPDLPRLLRARRRATRGG